jgi:hypothetical protein
LGVAEGLCVVTHGFFAPEGLETVVEHVVDGAIAALYQVREFGRALDDDFGQQLGGGQRRWGIEQKVFESRVLFTHGVPDELKGAEEH